MREPPLQAPTASADNDRAAPTPKPHPAHGSGSDGLSSPKPRVMRRPSAAVNRWRCTPKRAPQPPAPMAYGVDASHHVLNESQTRPNVTASMTRGVPGPTEGQARRWSRGREARSQPGPLCGGVRPRGRLCRAKAQSLRPGHRVGTGLAGRDRPPGREGRTRPLLGRLSSRQPGEERSSPPGTSHAFKYLLQTHPNTARRGRAEPKSLGWQLSKLNPGMTSSLQHKTMKRANKQENMTPSDRSPSNRPDVNDERVRTTTHALKGRKGRANEAEPAEMHHTALPKNKRKRENI